MMKTVYDAVVIGAGPNGLAAAITLQQQGLSVVIFEAADTIGGGTRTKDLTLPGFAHDICSAIHPLAAGSPFFRSLPLESFGLEFLYPLINAAHPLDDGPAAVHYTDLQKTADALGSDGKCYAEIFTPIMRAWPQLEKQLLGPFRIPANPLPLMSFGLKGLRSASSFAKVFAHKKSRALFAGMAAHAIQPLTNYGTAAFGLVLMAAGHAHGWPVAKGGSQSISDALGRYFVSIGGRIELSSKIESLKQLPSSKAILFDTSPDQLLKLAGHKFSSVYKWQLDRYRYGLGTFKIDWALDGPIPFSDIHCRDAGTVHLGNSLEEIASAEAATWKGEHPDKPYVLLAQQSIVDPGRAPSGKHTAWAYCHVPNGSTKDMSAVIEQQVERYAPGFRDRIIGKHSFNSEQLHLYNNNYVGGDINGGAINLSQLFTRPVIKYTPYRTSSKGIYICSASTPPGGGVHGMCGYHAARTALRDIFHIRLAAL